MRHAHVMTRPLAHRAHRAFLRHRATVHPRPRPAEDGFDWEASGWAGLGAGAAFIVIQTALVSLFNGDPDVDAIRQIAAIALGDSVLPAPTSFTALVFLAAMGVHLILSLLYARVLAALIHGLPAERAIAIGAGFGAVLYVVNYYAFTSLFPWFELSRGWITLSAHVAFGALAAGIYEWLTLPASRAPRSPTLL